MNKLEKRAQRWAEKAFEEFKDKLPKKKPRPEKFEPGQIWSTSGTKNIMLTIVDRDEKGILLKGVPVSDQWMFAGMDDLIIGPEDNPLGNYIIMLQLGFETSLQAEILEDYLGEVAPNIFAAAQTLLIWLDGEDIEHHYIATHMVAEEDKPWDCYPVMHWSFKDPVTNQTHIVMLGQRIHNPEDPRIEFRKEVLKNL